MILDKIDVEDFVTGLRASEDVSHYRVTPDMRSWELGKKLMWVGLPPLLVIGFFNPLAWIVAPLFAVGFYFFTRFINKLQRKVCRAFGMTVDLSSRELCLEDGEVRIPPDAILRFRVSPGKQRDSDGTRVLNKLARFEMEYEGGTRVLVGRGYWDDVVGVAERLAELTGKELEVAESAN
jgi:hypothetical protein